VKEFSQDYDLRGVKMRLIVEKMDRVKSLMWKVVLIWIICAIFSIACFFNIHKNDPVGLAVIRPNIEFFECAREVHGNYQFYYDSGRNAFMFIRAGELCSVDTWEFRKHYIDIYGRSNEIFIAMEKS